MPTLSQSQILSAVDRQLYQQQQASGQDGTTLTSSNRIRVNQPSPIDTKRRQSRDDRRPSIGKKDYDEKQSLPLPTFSARRRSSTRNNDGIPASRASQRNEILHMSIVDLNTTTNRRSRTPQESSQYRRSSINNDNQIETKQLKINSTPVNNNSSLSDIENVNDYDDDDNEEDENLNNEQRLSLLNEYGRRLLVLGTIRPSKSFYKDLPQCDVEHLMEYFQRMRNGNRKLTSEEINQELKKNFIEYKPKIFFDSACVTKVQVNNIEKMIEPYAEKIRTHQAELIKLDNPFRFVIKSFDNDIPLITFPREYNDCLLTLVTRADPLRKSDLITELIQAKLIEDVKANSLDISYFPGGVNYEVPREEIDENGLMQMDTYQKLKRRLNSRKIWYFNSPPEKKPNALLAILPLNSSLNIDHQHLLNSLYENLKTFPINENYDISQRILSIEFVPLSCILNSSEISNQFIIDCDRIETKQQLIDKPLQINLNKHLITIELKSYDENIQREYEKSVKAEKYRELIKNHDEAIKRTSTK